MCTLQDGAGDDLEVGLDDSDAEAPQARMRPGSPPLRTLSFKLLAVVMCLLAFLQRVTKGKCHTFRMQQTDLFDSKFVECAKPLLRSMPLETTRAVMHATAILETVTRSLYASGELAVAVANEATAAANAVQRRLDKATPQTPLSKLPSISACSEVFLAATKLPVLSLYKFSQQAAHVACGKEQQPAEASRAGPVWPKKELPAAARASKLFGWEPQRVVYSAAHFSEAVARVGKSKPATRPDYFCVAVVQELHRTAHVSGCLCITCRPAGCCVFHKRLFFSRRSIWTQCILLRT